MIGFNIKRSYNGLKPYKTSTLKEDGKALKIYKTI